MASVHVGDGVGGSLFRILIFDWLLSLAAAVDPLGRPGPLRCVFRSSSLSPIEVLLLFSPIFLAVTIVHCGGGGGGIVDCSLTP